MPPLKPKLSPKEKTSIPRANKQEGYHIKENLKSRVESAATHHATRESRDPLGDCSSSSCMSIIILGGGSIVKPYTVKNMLHAREREMLRNLVQSQRAAREA